MLRPRQDYITVKPLTRRLSAVLEVNNTEKHCRGVVVAVGPGKRDKRGNLVPLITEVGQTVIFGDGNFDFYPKFHDHKPDGSTDEYRIIQENDVVAVCEDDLDVIAA